MRRIGRDRKKSIVALVVSVALPKDAVLDCARRRCLLLVRVEVGGASSEPVVSVEA
ncbi:hypothetical protein [Lysobacter firmicutimachus]|uniref:Uncharacterized protein n=1 Tax=Lysobacter firmicutimachus TaxID=1792846 RepID=A0ABU8CXY9_9GAMM